MKRVTLDGRDFAAPDNPVDLIALDRALDGLAVVDERKCRVVEMRFFAGLTVEEAAVALHVSEDTIKRDWRIAKLWLLNYLEVDS
jgi:DNA-directed RNA polymerase specialized sigma24 family protein